jgi:hypothetical protein
MGDNGQPLRLIISRSYRGAINHVTQECPKHTTVIYVGQVPSEAPGSFHDVDLLNCSNSGQSTVVAALIINVVASFNHITPTTVHDYIHQSRKAAKGRAINNKHCRAAQGSTCKGYTYVRLDGSSPERSLPRVSTE